MKHVLISERETRRLVASIPITMGGANYVPSDDEYIAQAWKCAVEDKTVDPQRKADYAFEIRDVPRRL